METLDELKPNAAVRGILPDSLVTVVSVTMYGSEALELTYKTPAGSVDHVLLFRDDLPRLEVVERGRPWSFDGDGSDFRLVSEAHRIQLAYLFDPLLAVHTSVVEPLPHQITAVYETMLPRQPLRFLLAARARAVLDAWRPGDYPTRVFLLGPRYATNFVKDSSGGMMTSKQYFDISSLTVADAEELAVRLRGQRWSQLGR